MLAFNLRASAIAALFASALLPALAYPDPGTVTGDYTGVHDPSKLCKDSAGKYWLFSTGVGIPIRTSTDRTNWVDAGTVWPSGASWTNTYTGATNGLGSLWAPDCTYLDGTFYLYYAASSFGSQNSAIFFAKSTTGASGSWINEGLVTSTATGATYNAIDPDLVIDGSNWWLVFGSYWTGIKLIPLGSSTGKPSSTSIYSLASYSNGIEGSGIFKYGSYYYLFASRDTCCEGLSSTYNIRVVRSTSITGPYVDASGLSFATGGGTLVLETHDYVVGPGGQSVYQDADGIVLVYHYYTSTSSNLGINLLSFSTGWPVVY